MRSTLASLMVLGAVLNGCVIYETEHPHDDTACWGVECEDDDRPGAHDDEDPTPGEDPGTGDDPGAGEDPGGDDTGTLPDPEPLYELWLSATSAAQGESLLVWLEADGEFDFSTLGRIVFVGDVEVSESVLRQDEAFFLVEVAPDAELGVVQVIVELTDGGAYLIPGGFTVTEAAGSGGTTGGGTTGGGTTGGC